MRGVVAGILVCSGRIAASDGWPLEVVDRPLLTPAGGTGVEVDGLYRSYVDQMKRAQDFTPEVAAWHGFGPVELGVGIGQFGYGYAEIDLGGPALTVGAAFSGPQPDGRYDETQHLGMIYKAVLIPAGLAVVGSATAYLNERRIPVPGIAGHVLSVDPSLTIEIQVDRHLALSLGSGLYVPVEQSPALHDQVQLRAGAQLLYAIARWDFYVAGTVYDITRRGPESHIAAGFIKRWL